MNLILFLGTKFWGFTAFKVIFIILLSLAIFLSLILIFSTKDDKKILVVDLVVYFLFLIIMLCLGLPVKGIIWTFPFVHIFFIVQILLNRGMPLNVICYLIGDVIGFTLFYKCLL